MAKTINQKLLDDIIDANADAPHSEQITATAQRIGETLETLRGKLNAEPNISQIADEMAISRQQLALWFKTREATLFVATDENKREFITWLDNNLSKLSYDNRSNDVIWLLGKRDMNRAFDKKFGRKYGAQVRGAFLEFWRLLTLYGAESGNAKSGERFQTATRMRRYSYRLMRQEYLD